MEKKTVSVTDSENGRPQAHVNNNDVFVYRVDDDPRNRRGDGGDNFSNNCESNSYKTVGARRKHRQEEPKRCDSTTKAYPAFSAGKNTQRTVPANYANNQYFDNKNRLGGIQTSSLSQLHAYDSDESEEIGEISSVTFNRTNPSGMAFETVKPELHTSGTQAFTEAVQQLGELTIDELPPVTVPQTEVQPEECELVGYISNIVNKLIMVKSLPNQPVFNIDTLLFIEKGKQPLGYIFDVIGQVSSPQYIIRYNTPEEIEDLFVEVGTPVYSAPRTEHSQYVFVQQLMK